MSREVRKVSTEQRSKSRRKKGNEWENFFLSLAKLKSLRYVSEVKSVGVNLTAKVIILRPLCVVGLCLHLRAVLRLCLRSRPRHSQSKSKESSAKKSFLSCCCQKMSDPWPQIAACLPGERPELMGYESNVIVCCQPFSALSPLGRA